MSLNGEALPVADTDKNSLSEWASSPTHSLSLACNALNLEISQNTSLLSILILRSSSFSGSNAGDQFNYMHRTNYIIQRRQHHKQC